MGLGYWEYGTRLNTVQNRRVTRRKYVTHDKNFTKTIFKYFFPISTFNIVQTVYLLLLFLSSVTLSCVPSCDINLFPFSDPVRGGDGLQQRTGGMRDRGGGAFLISEKFILVLYPDPLSAMLSLYVLCCSPLPGPQAPRIMFMRPTVSREGED